MCPWEARRSAAIEVGIWPKRRWTTPSPENVGSRSPAAPLAALAVDMSTSG